MHVYDTVIIDSELPVGLEALVWNHYKELS